VGVLWSLERALGSEEENDGLHGNCRSSKGDGSSLHFSVQAMSRAAAFFTYLSVSATAYVGLLMVDLPTPVQQILTVVSIWPRCILLARSDDPHPQIPWWTLVAFGSYSLWTLGWAMLSFRECPDAFLELTKASLRLA